jgi:hypothetical protein
MNALPIYVIAMSQSGSSLITDANLKASYKAIITAKLTALQNAFNTYFASLQAKSQ